MSAAVAIGDDVGGAREVHRADLAHYAGGMGSRRENFYADLMRRFGLCAAADAVQHAYLSGDRRAAAAAVPEELVAATGLIGTAEEVAERLAAFAAAGATTVNAVLVSHGRERRRADLPALRELVDSV